MSKAFVEFENLHKRALDSQPSWLKAEALMAAKVFQNLGLPDRKSEDWKYTDLNFMNKFAGALSDLEVGPQVHLNTSSADPRNSSLLQTLRQEINQWLKESSIENLNMALAKGGNVIRIPRGRTLCERYVVQGKGWLSPRMVIFLEEDSELVLFEENAIGEGDIVNSNIDVKLSRGSKLKFVRLQNNHLQANHVSTIRVVQESDSYFEYFNFAFGSSVGRDNVFCKLAESATCDLKGLAVARRGQHHDQFIFVDHASPRASSRQLFKNVVGNGSRVVFNGKVVVQKGSMGTDAQQLNKNLLLGKSAEADARPQLEIANDDVKCSHGSTIGRLNPDELFYLQSRGISKKNSVDLLCRAFVDEIASKVEDEVARSRIVECLSLSFSELETDHGY